MYYNILRTESRCVLKLKASVHRRSVKSYQHPQKRNAPYTYTIGVSVCVFWDSGARAAQVSVAHSTSSFSVVNLSGYLIFSFIFILNSRWPYGYSDYSLVYKWTLNVLSRFRRKLRLSACAPVCRSADFVIVRKHNISE